MDLSDVGRYSDELAKKNGWYEPTSAKPQTPRNLCISVVLEAAELLECFQWDDSADLTQVADELSDIVLYACQVANVTGIDLSSAIQAKISKNQHRSWME